MYKAVKFFGGAAALVTLGIATSPVSAAAVTAAPVLSVGNDVEVAGLNTNDNGTTIKPWDNGTTIKPWDNGTTIKPWDNGTTIKPW